MRHTAHIAAHFSPDSGLVMGQALSAGRPGLVQEVSSEAGVISRGKG
jgi:hypothetical protein